MRLENVLGIEIILLGRYGVHKWHRFGSKGLETGKVSLLKAGFWLARLGRKKES